MKTNRSFLKGMCLLILLFGLIVLSAVLSSAEDPYTYYNYNNSSAASSLGTPTNTDYTTASVENGIFRIAKTAGKDALFSKSFATSTHGATVTVEFSLSREAGSALLPVGLRLRNNGSNTTNFFSLAASGQMTLSANGTDYPLGVLPDSGFTDLAFSVTFNSGDGSAYTVDAYVDGILYRENLPLSMTGTVTCLSPVSYYLYFSSNSTGVLLTDDFKVSSATAPTLSPGSGAIIHLVHNAADYADGTMSYPYGLTTVLPTAAQMSRTGYEFTGWYENADCSGTPVTEIAASARGVKTLYSAWKAKKYTVTWNVDGNITAEQLEYGTTPVYSGSTVKAPTADYAYAFCGWYNGSMKAFLLPPVTGNVTYTAVYDTEPGYTVLYYRTYEGINPMSGLSTKTTSAVIEAVTSGGNTCISHTVNATVTSDSYAEKSFTTIGQYMILSVSFSTTGSVPSGYAQYKGASGTPDRASFFSISANGAVTCGGVVIGTIEAGKWLDLTFVVDLDNYLITAYADGVKKVDSFAFITDETADATGAKLMRFYITSSTTNAGRNLLIDNWAMYTGNTVRVLADPETYGASSPDTLTSAVFDGSVAMKTGVDAMLVGGLSSGIRSEIPAPVSYSGATYVPAAVLAQAFGYSVSGTNPMTLTGAKTVVLSSGNSVTVNGAAVSLSSPAIVYDGVLMLSAADAATVFGKTLFAPTMGLILFSDDARVAALSDYTDKTILTTLLEAFVFDNPTGDQIVSAMSSQHPRLIATPAQFAATRAAYLASGSGPVKTWVTSLVTAASGSLTRANPVYGYDVGDRMGTGSNTYLFNWGFAYQMTLDTKYADRSLQWIWALSQFDDWCPGHSLNCAETAQGVAVAYDWMYDAWTASGYWTTAKVSELLGSAAAATLTVKADGTLDVKELIEDTLYYYGIASAVGSYNATRNQVNNHGVSGRSTWTNGTNNWNCVCNSGYLMAAIALADVETLLTDNIIVSTVSPLFSATADPDINVTGAAKPGLLSSSAYCFEGADGTTTYADEIATLLTKIMQSIKIGIRCYVPDGSYGESSGYWAYGTNNFFLLCETLYAATGTTYGLMETAGIDRTLYFAMNIENSDQISWNYHDSSSTNMATQHAAFAGPYFGDGDIYALRYNSVIDGNKGATIYDALFYDASLASTVAALPLDYYMEGIDTVTMRTSWNPGAIFTGLHGGYNSVNHGDMDAGNFIYDAMGIRWFGELGSDNYNLPGYFGKGDGGASWKYFKKSAEGQSSIIVVNDATLPYGQNPTATVPVTEYYSDASHVYSVLDMSGTLGAYVLSAERAMMLLRGSGVVVLQDEAIFSRETCLYWLAQTAREITLSEDGKTAYLTSGAYTLRVSLLSDDTALVFSVIDDYTTLVSTTSLYTEGEYSRTGWQRLAVYAHNVAEFHVSVVMEMIDDTTEPLGYTATPIASWATYALPAVAEVIGATETGGVFNADGTYTVPSAASVWIGSDGEVYRAGDILTVSSDLRLTAVGISLLDGASIRTDADGSGLRFESTVPESTVEAASAAGITLTAGTLILPTDRLTVGFTKAALTEAGIPFLDLSTTAFLPGTGDRSFYAAITDLLGANYTRSFSAVSYVTFSSGGETYTVYSSYDAAKNSRSVYRVASLLYATDSAAYSPATLAVVKSFIDGVVELTSDTGTRSFRNSNRYIDALPAADVTLSYASPSGVSYDDTNNRIVLTNGSAIVTVILDGVTYTSGWTVSGGNLLAPYRFPGDPDVSVADKTTADTFRDGFGDSFGS